MAYDSVSIIIPAKNEEQALQNFLPELIHKFPTDEIIIINDGSTDNTSLVCKNLGVKVIEHPYNLGNGGAIKSGARAASNDVIVFMDGDGQHSIDDIEPMLKRINDGYDMVVGARETTSHAGKRRLIGNTLYNFIASLVVGQKIEDLTSGFRAVKTKKFREFLHLLPNGFSYPTTITMAFFRTGYTVAYHPIKAKKRIGNSHLKLLKDGPKFLIIIVKIAALYSPLKVLTPVSVLFFILGLINYAHTFYSHGTFTNMSALLMIISVLLFIMGLIAEQMTIIMYAMYSNKKK